MTHFTSDQLTDFVHGELSPDQDARAHAHLADCGACRTQYDAEIALGEYLRHAAATSELEFPSLIKAAVWQKIRDAKPTPAMRLAAWLRPAVAVPVAAVLVIGGAWFASPNAHGAHPTIDATYYLEAHAAQASRSILAEPSNSAVLETSMLDGTSGGATSLAEAVDAVR